VFGLRRRCWDAGRLRNEVRNRLYIIENEIIEDVVELPNFDLRLGDIKLGFAGKILRNMLLHVALILAGATSH